ncbi:hypothetical protein [Micromonospora sp. NPDC049645]|uniref:hypothetical protein n=1 Tax=Micromonospora sp. NPDC049645 TaxID=3155508 RepID=UPI00341550F5
MSRKPRRQRPADPMARDRAVWVESGVAADGTFVVEVHADGDWSFALDRDRALAYVATVYDAAARAEYDAAILRQLTSRGLSREVVGEVIIKDLRPDRPPLNDAATAPLTFTPIVSEVSGHPFVHVHVHGRSAREPQFLAQWKPASARQHAGHVLDALAVVDLDAGYLRALVGVIGIDAPRARAVVATLADHRRPAA